MTISERIFSLLEAQNKKQADLARALGVRQNTVTNWKKSNYKPNIDLKMIIPTLGILRLSPHFSACLLTTS